MAQTYEQVRAENKVCIKKLGEHQRRITELEKHRDDLQATNTAEVERRRNAEAMVDTMRRMIRERDLDIDALLESEKGT